MVTSSSGRVVMEKRRPRRGCNANPTEQDWPPAHRSACRPHHGATSITTTWVIMMQHESSSDDCFRLAGPEHGGEEWQHRGVGEVKEHRAGHEDENLRSRAQVGDPRRWTLGRAAPGGGVVDIAWSDERDRRPARERTSSAVTQKIAIGDIAYPTRPMRAADARLPAESNRRFRPSRRPSSPLPDYSQRERHDDGAHHARRGAVKGLCGKMSGSPGPTREDDRREGRGNDSARDESALVARRVDPGTDRDSARARRPGRRT